MGERGESKVREALLAAITKDKDNRAHLQHRWEKGLVAKLVVLKWVEQGRGTETFRVRVNEVHKVSLVCAPERDKEDGTFIIKVLGWPPEPQMEVDPQDIIYEVLLG